MEKSLTFNMNTKFTNPYPLGPYNPETHARINAEVPKDWYMSIRAMVPTGGIQTTACILWHKLEQLCKQKGISNATDANRFINLVNNLILSDGRESGSTPSGFVRDTYAPDERRTKKGKSNGNKTLAG
jgi:hypothetical protein